MPYDKGDFTQQGVDGKVAGGLLLNNKRDVDVIVSTNEDNSTIDSVAFTIEDHLNDLKYTFVGENLEAGEVYEIGAGGTEITNPILTINVDASGVAGDIGALPLIINNDGTLQNISGAVVGGSTQTYETIVLDFYEEGDSYFYWNGTTAYPNITGYVGTLTVSNEVNVTVTLNQGEGTFYAEITDPTEPASFTLTVS